MFYLHVVTMTVLFLPTMAYTCDNRIVSIGVTNLVSIGEGKHTFPSRTRSLSPQPPMVVPPRWGARVGYRQSYGPSF